MKYAEERAAVAATAAEMERRDLTIGTAGNVSCRVDEGAIITPSSMPYPDITATDTILMTLDGEVLSDDGVSERPPSIEHQVHLELYRSRADIGAVIHAHPIYASAFAAARVALPAFLDEFGVFVGDEVRVAEYAISGTPDLARNVAAAMGETANAALIASHGLVAAGRDLSRAMHVARMVERGALVYLWTKVLGGPVDLPAESQNLFAQVFQYFRTS